MDNSVLSFVKSHVPHNWDYIHEYTTSFVLFTLDKYSREYQQIESLFQCNQITRIQRVQNPFQFGRYMLRREMLQSNFESTVFHGVHRDDMDTALNFNCDYRRYQRKHEHLYDDGQHPKFYNLFSELLNSTIHPLCDIVVFVMKTLTQHPQSQCDYFIEYIVKF